MNTLFDEALAAVADESVVKLRELDVSAWQAQGGITDAAIKSLLARDEQESMSK